jgi:hypothetical protein
MTTETVVRFIIEVLAASGIVSALFIFVGTNWIENQFARRLKAYERKQNSLFNRITKIHEKEIEVLPAAWQNLMEAHGHLARLIQPTRIEREFSQMNEEQLKEWQREHEEIGKSFMKFHNYFLNNSIFLSPDLFAEFKAIDELFNTSLIKSRIAKQGLNASEFTLEIYENIYEKTEPIKERIRDLVQKRLHYQDAD